MSFIRIKYIKGKPYMYEQSSTRENGRIKSNHVRYIGKYTSGHLGTTPINGIDPKKISSEFGYTNDPKEAGYIMKDGKMLDFSGRRQASGYTDGKPNKGEPDYLKGSHSLDHREISKVIDDKRVSYQQRQKFKDSRYEYVKYFGEKTGSVRFFVVGNQINAEFFKKPTKAQLDQIRSAHNDGNRIIYADINYNNKKGEYKKFQELEKSL